MLTRQKAKIEFKDTMLMVLHCDCLLMALSTYSTTDNSLIFTLNAEGICRIHCERKDIPKDLNLICQACGLIVMNTDQIDLLISLSRLSQKDMEIELIENKQL